VFTALGANVTLLDVADRVVPFMDAEISDVLARTFTKMGMRVVLGSGVATVERVHGKLQVALVGGENLDPDTVLFGPGRQYRRPRT
jgi:pyruvate/2-oxoglutarate dehydrogenase complex dihydrolipoamide dehydrogenase (E3) component